MNKFTRKLTDRQILILTKLSDGMSDGEIATDLKLSVGSIRRYIDDMLKIFSTRNRTSLAVQAIRSKVIK